MSKKPWLRPVLVQPPAALPAPPDKPAGGGAAAAGGPVGRMHPLIYIYDMPPEFTTRMLQYKLTQWVAGAGEEGAEKGDVDVQPPCTHTHMCPGV